MENVRTESAQHRTWQKNHTLENGKNCTPGKWQKGNCTLSKIAENAHTGKCMGENTHQENGRTETARYVKWQKRQGTYTLQWKMAGQKMKDMENC